MKKNITYFVINNLFVKTFCLLFFVLLGTQTNAQVNTYNLQQMQITPAYTGLSASSTLLFATSGNVDDGVSTVTMPFTFAFNGSGYSSINISLNGFVTFGTAPAANEVTPISSTAGYSGAISPFGCDLDLVTANASLANVKYEVIGSAPNRIFKIQWGAKRSNNLGTAFASDASPINFQLWLYETTNVPRVRASHCSL